MRFLFVASRHNISVKSGLGEWKGLYIALIGVAGVIVPALIGAVTQLVLMSMRAQSTTETRRSSRHSEQPDSRSKPPGTLVSEANKHTSFSDIKDEDKSVATPQSSVDDRDNHRGYTPSYSSNGSSSMPNTLSSAIFKTVERT
mgnify:CR=1 FL=1